MVDQNKKMNAEQKAEWKRLTQLFYKNTDKKKIDETIKYFNSMFFDEYLFSLLDHF